MIPWLMLSTLATVIACAPVIEHVVSVEDWLWCKLTCYHEGNIDYDRINRRIPSEYGLCIGGYGIGIYIAPISDGSEINYKYEKRQREWYLRWLREAPLRGDINPNEREQKDFLR